MVDYSFIINRFSAVFHLFSKETSSPEISGSVSRQEFSTKARDPKPKTQPAAPAVKCHSSAPTFIKTAVFLFLFVSLASAQCVENTTSIILQEQGGNIGIVLMLTVVIIAIAYMAGSVTGKPEMLIFSKDELFHLFFSIILLLSFSGLMAFSCQITQFFFTSTFENLDNVQCYADGAGLSTVSTCYLDQMENTAKQMSTEYIRQNIKKTMDSAFLLAIPIPLTNTLSMVAGSYRRVHAQQYDMLLNSFALPALLSISMQKILLDFINENVITWILPIAFLLRVFIPTRQMGNILIALAVGLYLIIPLFYTFNLAMYDSVLNECSTFSAAIEDRVLGSCNDPYSFWAVAKLVPQAVFLPNLTIALFITFMAAVNKALKVIG